MFSEFLTGFWAVRELWWKYSPPPQFFIFPKHIQYHKISTISTSQRVSHQGSSQNQRFLRFHHIKRANNLFSILKLLLTVPKIDKKTSTINMKNLGQLCHFWDNGQKLGFGEVGAVHPPQIWKKMKKFDLNQKLPQNREIPLFWWETRWVHTSRIF